ncbi:hypothetical protein EMPG_15762 [Blastomyces silverae]|uniref:NCT transcriptional regulatory complex subunit A n=1 Tax=Blastomyces silverae TaxID=2060906 RepID=A0A0H1BBJ6_9EURO|nr:hypothetical protein EMPG_15762 [Blastomyces silverae]
MTPAMTDQDNSYRPRSPDFSGFPGSLQLPPSPYGQPPYPLNSPLAHRASYDASPFFSPQAHQPQPQLQRPTHQQYIPQPFDSNYPPHIMPPQTSHPAKMRGSAPSQASGGIEVRTKFPVARIKRIMQADEDVGKVAQVTPIAVSKALELFMISLVTKAAQEARSRSSKRVTAAHLKEAISKDEVLDFLADIISKVPDHPAGGKKDDDGSDHNDGRRRKGGGRRKKEDHDDF